MPVSTHTSARSIRSVAEHVGIKDSLVDVTLSDLVGATYEKAYICSVSHQPQMRKLGRVRRLYNASWFSANGMYMAQSI